ncbi:class I SAM-dependent methyltransferase [Thermogemmatispora sp.]|uniref:class I SAM-dependent methyltransferase n=1 Tax=Thermogemmatispora sp. TaxID=1968838 RepID=UPI0035E43F32
MATQQSIDYEKAEAFAGKVIADIAAGVTLVMASLGDRLGLFKVLTQAPATSIELAERAHINERYAREWLSEMASAGYLVYDPANQRFSLPPEHAPVLAQEGGPFFLGGVYQLMMAQLGVYNQLVHAFQHGGGVPMEAYDPALWEGQERFSNSFFEHLLVQAWLPAMPDVQAKLERGALVADVGCGAGRALIKLAQAYPQSRYVGYDMFAPAIVRATANAQAAGVADRVRFVHLDVSQGLPEQYDVISTFDVVHDAVNPRGLLRAIRAGLQPEGRYVCLEFNSSEKLEDNAGLTGSLFYGISILYCMTVSLAGHGEGLGTLGLPEAKLRQFCMEAGFSHVRRVPVEAPFNVLYEIWA